MKVLNPNHPVNQFLTEAMYQKLLSILVTREPDKQTFISAEDFNELNQADMCLVVHFHEENIELRIIPMEEAQEVAQNAGGLPI